MNNSATVTPNDGSFSPRAILSPLVLIYVVGCFILTSTLFQPAYSVMWQWWQRDDYNHCMFVPLIVLYLLWEKRSLLQNIPAVNDWRGLLPLGFGVGLYWLGELGGEFYTLYLASWCVFTGFYWLLLGWRQVRAAAFPLMFLIAMFPFPNFVNNNLTFKLKLISSQLGVKLLQLYGMSAYREGNVIDLGFTRLQVVDACSGLRFFLPLIVLAILLAYYYKASWWKRLLLVILAVPLTIAMNSLRIASVGVLYQFFGPQVAEGFFHDFSGWFVFMVSLGLLLGCMWSMRRFLPESGRHPERTARDELLVPVKEKARFCWSFALLVPVLLLGGSLVAATSIDFREKVPLRTPFSAFPEQLAEWSGNRQTMEKIYLDELGLSDYIIVDYRNPRGRQVSFYTAYNESQRKGKSSHTPATCLPGSGWSFNESGIVVVSLADGTRLEATRALMEKNGEKQLAYFWFPQRGRVLHNLFELKWYAFWDALTRRRTDGALVRLITPIAKDETLQDAETRLQGFAGVIAPVLNRFLPGKDV